jgi:hypothetical protein
MKTQTTFALVLGVLAVATLAGCRTGPAQQPDAPTENVSATVDAAIEATRTAEQSQAATVAAAVSATQTSTAAQAPATPTPPPEEPPTPTPSSEEYVTMTEEELAALVDEAVNEAVLATQDATAATETSTADGTVTQEEIETIEVVLADAEEAIALAEELIYIYADLYAELATEALIVLQEVEMLLEETTELVEATTAVVDEMAQLLDQGLELSAETISQLIALAEAAGVNATAIQTKAEGWLVGLQAELEQRATTVLAVLPTEIATDRRTAIASAYTYIETVQSALVDNKLSQLELSAIAQAGANASASLLAQGGPQLQNLADSLNDITARLAQGQLPDVQGLLESLEASLPPRPSLP